MTHRFECADCGASLGSGETLPGACHKCGSTVVMIHKQPAKEVEQ